MTWAAWLLGDVEVPAIAVDDRLLLEPAVVSRRQLAAMMVFARALAFEEFGALVHAWGRYLDPDERAALVEALVLAAPDESEAEALVDAAIAAAAGGPPLPTFLGLIRHEADEWSAQASLAEVKFYALACFRRLPPVDRVNFLRAAQKVALE